MMNKIFTTLNDPLDAQIYSLFDPAGNPIFQKTLDGLPLGTHDNSSSGEIGVKVILISDRSVPSGGAATEAKQDDEIASLQKIIPATLGEEITPSDTADSVDETRAVFVGTGGTTLKVTMAGGGDITFTNVPDGSLLPIAVTRIFSTGTDATDIVALR